MNRGFDWLFLFVFVLSHLIPFPSTHGAIRFYSVPELPFLPCYYNFASHMMVMSS